MSNEEFYESLSIGDLERFAKKTFGTPPSDLKQILSIIKPDQTILEIGAGTGRLGLELVKKGFNYTGVDKEERYLKIFREELNKDNLKATLVNTSFEDLDPKPRFDVIIFSWTVIGDFTKKDQEKALKKSFTHLNKEGICLIDNPSKNQSYNRYGSYSPTPFYYKEWKDKLTRLGFSHKAKIYKTKTGVERELTILNK